MPDTLGAPRTTKCHPARLGGRGATHLEGDQPAFHVLHQVLLLSSQGPRPPQEEQEEEGSAGSHGSGEGPGQQSTGSRARVSALEPAGEPGRRGGAGLPFWTSGSLSLLWNAFRPSGLRGPRPLPSAGLIKHRWPHCRAARSLNHLAPGLQAPWERTACGQSPRRRERWGAPEKTRQTLSPCFRRPPALT